MIQYTLKCADGHETESWFQSSDAYEALEKAGHLSCGVCGNRDITKGLMAPKVRTRRTDAAPDLTVPAETTTQPVLRNPDAQVEQAISELRAKVEETSDYVGENFAHEARAMHLGDAPERSIYGEARLDQAKELIEDGVPLMPLPFRPKKKLS